MSVGQSKILVVDDEPQVLEILDTFLSMKGYEVTTAGNGQDALSRYKEGRPHIVLLDIRMPEVSGMDVLRKIRESDQQTVVIVVSGFGDMETVQEALEMGADHYIEKPMNLSGLFDTLTSCQDIREMNG